jgi:ELWxxDGT repeat protein
MVIKYTKTKIMRKIYSIVTVGIMLIVWNAKAQQTPEMIKNINELGLSASPSLLTLVDGKLFFTASNTQNGDELWVSDGSPGGTHLVKDITPGADLNPLVGAYGSEIANIVALNGLAYFIVRGGYLWKSDGTEGGTQQVAMLSHPTIGGDRLMTNVNGTLYFMKGTHQGSELWKSDGTTTGTGKVHTINTDNYYSSGINAQFEVTQMIALKNRLIFVADNGVSNHEVWVSDGTEIGTYILKEIRSGATGSDPKYLTELNGNIYFTANDGIHGYELWKTDGTPLGTELVIDLELGSGSGYPENITNVNGSLYFSASNGIYYAMEYIMMNCLKVMGRLKAQNLYS